MEAVVVARGNGAKTGAAQSIRRSTIEEMPSITRGIADVAKINPFVRTNGDGAMSIAGASNKYNPTAARCTPAWTSARGRT